MPKDSGLCFSVKPPSKLESCSQSPSLQYKPMTSFRVLCVHREKLITIETVIFVFEEIAIQPLASLFFS